ncbi:hypothetical protein F5Y15DRAFT_297313 [Xylariaceae sp. FL0016]|nr:hypothetical protein F5Y15DRAFT_297313 [Xylariaceae sp. FL0016]
MHLKDQHQHGHCMIVTPRENLPALFLGLRRSPKGISASFTADLSFLQACCFNHARSQYPIIKQSSPNTTWIQPVTPMKVLLRSFESILEDPEAVSKVKDASTRRRIAEAGRKLSISFEEPGDTLRRFGYMIIMPWVLCSYHKNELDLTLL